MSTDPAIDPLPKQIESPSSAARDRLIELLQGEPSRSTECYPPGADETIRAENETTRSGDQSDPADRLRAELADLAFTDARQAEEVNNRALVNLLYDRIYGESLLTRTGLHQFLELAADAIREQEISVAGKTLTAATADDARTASSETMNPAGTRRAQSWILERAAAWVRVRDHVDADQALLYALTVWAGRTARELADLLDRPIENVREDQALALSTVALAAGHHPGSVGSVVTEGS